MERSKAYFYRAPGLAIYCFPLLGQGGCKKKIISDTKTQDQATVPRLLFSEIFFSHNSEKSHGQLHLVANEVQVNSAH